MTVVSKTRIDDINAFVMCMLDEVHTHEKRRLVKMKEDLIEENHLLGGSEYGYYIDGQRIRNNRKVPYRSSAILNQIDPSLEERASNHLALTKKMEEDMLLISQTFRTVLNCCNTTSDILGVFPKYCTDTVPSLESMIHYPEDLSLEKLPETAQEDFKNACSLYEYYLGNRMLYS